MPFYTLTLYRCHKALSFLPLGWGIIFGLFVLRAYLKLGHLPAYDLPDPKEMGMWVHHGLSFWGLPLVLFSPPYWIVVMIIDRRSIRWWHIIVYAASYLAFLAFVCSGSFGLMLWLID